MFLGCLLILAHCGGIPKKSSFSLDQNPPPPETGQRYVYQHTGPLPWGDGLKDAGGLRVVTVTGPESPGKNPLWRFEEIFERVPGIQAGYYDTNYLLHHQVLREGENELRIQYKPPQPVRYMDLPREAEKTYRSRQTVIDSRTGAAIGTGEITATVRRGYDVRMVTPAGAYLCRHFTERIRMATRVEDLAVEMNAVVDSYWCDAIGWFVQAEYAFEPVIQNGTVVQPGYQAVSILTVYEPMDPTRLHPPGNATPSGNKRRSREK